MRTVVTLFVWVVVLVVVARLGLPVLRSRLLVSSNRELAALVVPGPYRGAAALGRGLASTVCRSAARLPSGGHVVPSRITVKVSMADYGTLTEYLSVDRLQDDLARLAVEHARDVGWELPEDGVTVALSASARIHDGWVLPAQVRAGRVPAQARQTRSWVNDHADPVTERWFSTPDAETDTDPVTQRYAAPLEIVGPDGAKHRVTMLTARLGRSATCDVVVDGASVSRYHVELAQSAGGWTVRDLDSANGTLVNGEEISSRAVSLTGGDSIRLGKNGPQLTVHIQEG